MKSKGIRQARPTRPVDFKLSSREKQVLEFLVRGMGRKQTATALGIEASTVAVHTKKIYRKLWVNNRTAAVVVALTEGLVNHRPKKVGAACPHCGSELRTAPKSTASGQPGAISVAQE